MAFFDSNGTLKIGVHKGTHFKKLTDSYLKWACSNIDGFEKELHGLRSGKGGNPHKREPFTLNIKSSSGHGGVANKGLGRPGKKCFVPKKKWEQARAKASSVTTKSKESPSPGVSGQGWGKPSSLVNEARERAEKRDQEEEAVHMHMPEDFEPEDFPEDEAPPW